MKRFPFASIGLLCMAGACAAAGETRAGPAAPRSEPEATHTGHAEAPGGPRPDASRHRPDGGMQHDFSDVERFEAAFDAPERAAWQHPAEVVHLLGAAPGQTVVDLGAGTGYFLPYLAVAVGASGRVLALDSEPAMIEHVRRRARREGLANVEARTVPAEGVELPPESVDRILVVDTWHHLPDRARYAAGLRDALRPGGEILVVDFTFESRHGPSVEHRLPPERVAEELASARLDVEVVSGEGLPDQYVVRAKKR